MDVNFNEYIKKIFKERSLTDLQRVSFQSKNDLFNVSVNKNDYIIKIFKNKTSFFIERKLILEKRYLKNIAIDVSSNVKEPYIVYKKLESNLLNYFRSESYTAKKELLNKAFDEIDHFHNSFKNFNKNNIQNINKKIANYLEKSVGKSEFLKKFKEKYINKVVNSIQIIHGDSHLANFLVDKQENVFLIDFEAVCLGHPMHDYATILFTMDIPFIKKKSLINKRLISRNIKKKEFTDSIQIYFYSIILKSVSLAEHFIKYKQKYFFMKERHAEFNNKISILKRDFSILIRSCIKVDEDLEKGVLELLNKLPFFC